MNRQRGFLLVVIALSTVVSFVVIRPFLAYVLGALVLAYILLPFHRRLTPHLGERLAALALIPAALVVVIAPLFYLGVVFLRDVTDLARGQTGLDTAEIEDEFEEATGMAIDLDAELAALTGDLIDVLFGSIPSVITTALKGSLGVALVLFLVYYLLKDGPRFVAWMKESTPLPADVTENLFSQIDATTWGVVVGHVFVAVLQAIVGGAGLWFVGIPNYVFWTFVMLVLALLPLIGAFMIWAPAAGYLFLIGEATMGTILLVYGVLVVSMIDNYVRPILIDREAQLNPGVILVGVFGGVYALGFVGLFVGPIVLGVLAASLVTFAEEYDRL
ncbi:AI-2E family transporter [Halalkalicoccus tibetensis]|uniref:AI-2E family transporter n=1 Tax=Halalkalicoccus tibetensis TaxID=175632 RepID=A0ABD5UXX3_9EURY